MRFCPACIPGALPPREGLPSLLFPRTRAGGGQLGRKTASSRGLPDSQLSGCGCRCMQPLPPRGPDRTWLRDSWRSPGPGSAQQRDPLNPLPQSTGFLLGDGEGTPGGCGWTIPITPWSSSWSWGGRGRGLGNHWGRPQASGLPLTSCEFRTHPPTWEVTGLPD